MSYSEFLKQKAIVDLPTGHNPKDLNSQLYDFQREITAWAIRRGRAAIFADCGLGKTPMQLSWADAVVRHINKPALILAPLAVSKQTKREGDKFGVEVNICRSNMDVKSGINITNYEMLHNFNLDRFGAVVLDESSILKSYTGRYRNQIIESTSRIPYRLACTATPAPNDYMELGNHAEYLGVVTRSEMLSMFFINDTSNVGTWRLKGHGQSEFWKWLCSWAVMIGKPSDIGFDDDGFILPELKVNEHVVKYGKPLPGKLFIEPAETLSERREARRETIEERAKKLLTLIGSYAILDYKKGDCQCQMKANISRNIIEKTGTKDSNNQKSISSKTEKNEKSICSIITKATEKNGEIELQKNDLSTTPIDVRNIKKTPNIEKNANRLQEIEQKNSAEKHLSRNMECQISSTTKCSLNKTEAVQYVARLSEIEPIENCISTIAIKPESLEDFCAQTATLELENLKTMLRCSKRQFLIWVGLNKEQDLLESIFGDLAFSVRGSQDDETKEKNIFGWLNKERPIMISKVRIMGWGLNLQQCDTVFFFGISDSYESYYQAIRRCWRFGQTRPVNVHIVTSDMESNIVENIRRKEKDATNMRDEMVKSMSDISSVEIRGMEAQRMDYKEDKKEGDGWTLYLGDSVEVIKQIPDESIHFSIFSPPFASLFTYSNSDRDMGNCRTRDEFFVHFDFLIGELLRVIKSGRVCSVHCMDLPATIGHDGFIGMKDFPGEIIRRFELAGWIYHSRVTIWKDPLIQAVRTKTLSLAHKQIIKDSTRCNQGMADYIVSFRKPGDNPEPVAHPKGFTRYVGTRDFPTGKTHDDQRKNKQSHEIWQRYASPVWFDINQTRVLSKEMARDEEDEKHVCPLQLDTIERCLELWSNPGDTVLSPFAGIGSEVYCAVEAGRQGIGIELKESYFKQAVKNLESIKRNKKQQELFA